MSNNLCFVYSNSSGVFIKGIKFFPAFLRSLRSHRNTEINYHPKNGRTYFTSNYLQHQQTPSENTFAISRSASYVTACLQSVCSANLTNFLWMTKKKEEERDNDVGGFALWNVRFLFVFEFLRAFKV